MNKQTQNLENTPAWLVRRATPRVFLVRWEDEDSGWHSLQAIAHDRQEAIDTIGNAIGRYDLQVHQCQ